MVTFCTQLCMVCCYMYILWFNFILGSNFLFFCFKLIILLLSFITIPEITKEKKIWTKDEVEPQHT